MGRLRDLFPRPVLLILLAALLVQAAIAAHLLLGRADPHRVDVLVVGPPILAQTLAERADALPGGPLRAVAEDERSAALDAVRDGQVVAAVLVDLAQEHDTLVVRSSQDPELVDAVRVRVAALGSTYDRGLRVREVDPPRNAGLDRRDLYLLPAIWILVGFLAAAAIATRRGVLARTGRLAALRVSATPLGALLVGALLALPTTVVWSDSFVATWLAGSAVVLAAVWLALALTALWGLAGIGTAVSLLVLLGTPAMTMRHVALLPAPWPWVVPLTPYGAGVELLSAAVQTGTTARTPWLVLGAWLLLPLLTMALGRRERPADPGPGQAEAGLPLRGGPGR